MLLGCSLRVLGGSYVLLEESLGAPWELLGAPWGFLGDLGCSLGALGCSLGAPWGLLAAVRMEVRVSRGAEKRNCMLWWAHRVPRC